MKAIFKKNTITNENFRVYKKESIYEDVFCPKAYTTRKIDNSVGKIDTASIPLK